MRKVIRNVVGAAMIFSTVCLFGCSNEVKEEAVKEKPMIAVSIVPEQTFVEAVCGDLVDIVTLVPSGSSPENYEPTAQEMEKFSDASLYFSIGVPTEEANILPNVGDIKVISLQDEVAAVYEDRTFESGERDPHIWLSPKRVKVMVETIAKEMSELDPDNKGTYEQNAADYIVKLDEVDQEIKDALKGVESKNFIVYHPAFGYIADDYGLKMYSLEEEGKEMVDVLFICKDNKPVANVGLDKMYVFRNDYLAFEELTEVEKRKLMPLLLKYIMTETNYR